jgi:subtilase family serine protease
LIATGVRLGKALGAGALALGLIGVVATSGWGADPSDIDLVVTAPASLAQQVSNSKAGTNTPKEVMVSSERGATVAVEAAVSNVGANDSGPFDVRFYLADRADGRGVVHEFDVVKKISVPGNGQVTVRGEYLIPFYPVVAGRSYWLVAQVDAHNDVAERNEENNRQVLSTVSVPCDELLKEEYVSEYLCPKFGEND